MGTTIATARTDANTLFNKSAPDVIDANGNLYYTDNMSYGIWIMKETAVDNVWTIAIWDRGSKIYLPSFRDYWGITIGTSRTFILNTYGYTYTYPLVFSIDSSTVYYNYSSLGIGFGFTIADGDWNCDVIQIAQPGKLQKRAANATSASQFPNFGKSDFKMPVKPIMKALPIKILKKFK